MSDDADERVFGLIAAAAEQQKMVAAVLARLAAQGDALARGGSGWLCFCNGPSVVKLRVHPIAGFVLLSVVGVRPPLHAV